MLSITPVTDGLTDSTIVGAPFNFANRLMQKTAQMSRAKARVSKGELWGPSKNDCSKNIIGERVTREERKQKKHSWELAMFCWRNVFGGKKMRIGIFVGMTEI